MRLHTKEIYGIAGIIRLLAGTYVLAITGQQNVGLYRGSPIYQITTLQFLSCNKKLEDLSLEERKDEAHYVDMLKVAEATPGLYFSYNTDLTLKQQLRLVPSYTSCLYTNRQRRGFYGTVFYFKNSSILSWNLSFYQ